MNSVRAVLLALLTIGGVLTGTMLVTAVTPAHDPTSLNTGQVDPGGVDSTGGAATTNSSSGTAPLGSKISAFMQSNAAQANGAVESGMWVASFNDTSNETRRSALVQNRTNHLERQLQTLRDREHQLVEKRKAGNISELKYESKMSNLIGLYLSLTQAINETAPLANETGVNASRLDKLHRDARNATGPEVAAVAQSMGGSVAPGADNETHGPFGASDNAGHENSPGNGENGVHSNDGTGGHGAEGNGTVASAGHPGEGDGPNAQNATDAGNATREQQANRAANHGRDAGQPGSAQSSKNATDGESLVNGSDVTWNDSSTVTIAGTTTETFAVTTTAQPTTTETPESTATATNSTDD